MLRGAEAGQVAVLERGRGVCNGTNGRADGFAGLAVGDLDGDGVEEIVVTQLGAGPTVYRVEAKRGNGLGLRLGGTKSNRSAIGARVGVTVGGKTLTEEVTRASLTITDLNRGIAIIVAGNAPLESEADQRRPLHHELAQ